jgi:hypothetical protein
MRVVTSVLVDESVVVPAIEPVAPVVLVEPAPAAPVVPVLCVESVDAVELVLELGCEVVSVATLVLSVDTLGGVEVVPGEVVVPLPAIVPLTPKEPELPVELVPVELPLWFAAVLWSWLEELLAVELGY